MSKLNESGMRTWIALARDTEGLHCYSFTATTASTHGATQRFKKVAQEQGWEPFDSVDVYLVEPLPENERMRKLTFFPMSR